MSLPTESNNPDCVIKRKPDWVKNAIQDSEGKALWSVITSTKGTTAIEVGVASGYSSAFLYGALSYNSEEAKLFSFDISEECYFDKARKTGQAFQEILGHENGYFLHTGLTSGEISNHMISCKVDFIFIDASHRNPWAALDLLSTARFLRPNGVIALHDVDMIFKKPHWRCNNASRDVFRTWIGDKFRFKDTPNLGFLRYSGDVDTLLKSVEGALLCDWDEVINSQTLFQYAKIVDSYEADSRLKTAIRDAILVKSDSFKFFSSIENIPDLSI